MESEVASHVNLSRPEQLLDLARMAVRADFGGVALLSAQGELVEQFTTGLSEETARGAAPLAVAGFTGPVRAATDGAGLFARLADQWASEAARAAGGWSVPRRVAHLSGSLPGRRVPGPCSRRGPFNPADVETVQSIGRFLEQGSLFEEARLLARLRLLNQVAQTAAGSLELEPILRIALRELDRLLPMQVCAVWLVEHSHGNETPAQPQASVSRFPSAFSDAPPLPVPVPQLQPEAGSPVALVLAETTAGPGALAPGVRLDLVSDPFRPLRLRRRADFRRPRSPDRTGPRGQREVRGWWTRSIRHLPNRGLEHGTAHAARQTLSGDPRRRLLLCRAAAGRRPDGRRATQRLPTAQRFQRRSGATIPSRRRSRWGRRSPTASCSAGSAPPTRCCGRRSTSWCRRRRCARWANWPAAWLTSSTTPCAAPSASSN